MWRTIRFSASSQEISFHSLEPASRTRGTLVRVSDLTKSSSAAPFGQSVPRFVGWSESPSMWKISAFSPFLISPRLYMMMPQATEQ
jgi:hypothetical protein